MIGMVVLGMALLGTIPADARTFSVTETEDLPDVNLCNGVCDADPFGSVRCTLRAAIDEANCNPGPDTIVFRSTLGTINLDFGDDLDIFFSVTIKGTSSKKQRINAFDNNLEGMFEIHGGDVNFEYLILEEGLNVDEDGGCIDIDDGNDVVRVKYVQFLNCASGGDGGAISSDADLLDVVGSKFIGNAADDDGGAINTEDDDARSVTKVKSSTFKNNFAEDDGGAMGQTEDDDIEQQVASSTFEGNTADSVGGGVAHFGTTGNDTADSGITIVQNSKFKNNSANFGGAMCDATDEGLFFPQGNIDLGGNVGHFDFSGQQDFFCIPGTN